MINIVALLFAISLALVVVQSAPSPASHLAEQRQNYRDLVNGDSEVAAGAAAKKKTKKYKCFVVEEDDDEIQIVETTARKNPQVNPKKFVYTEDEVAANNNEQIPHAPVEHVMQAPPTPVVKSDLDGPASSSFKQSEYETISEAEAAVEFPLDSYAQQQRQHQQRLVTLPPTTPTPLKKRPLLKRVHLPLAHPAAIAAPQAPREVTTIPPEVATALRDSENRPLVLSPEHCAQIKHYADMYGVSEPKEWVHNNCQFARVYLPTASCAEIDILVGSCYRSQ